MQLYVSRVLTPWRSIYNLLCMCVSFTIEPVLPCHPPIRLPFLFFFRFHIILYPPPLCASCCCSHFLTSSNNFFLFYFFFFPFFTRLWRPELLFPSFPTDIIHYVRRIYILLETDIRSISYPLEAF